MRRSSWIGGRQAEQAKGVRDRAALLADTLGELLLSPAECAEELVVCLGLFHRIEVLAQQVLDQGQLEALRVRDLANDRRDAGRARLPRSAPPPLTGDELITGALSPHDDGLNHARTP